MATATHNDSRTAHLLELMAKGDNAFNARDFETVDTVHDPDMIGLHPRARQSRSTGAKRTPAAMQHIPAELPRTCT